ncbi:MAG: outer membrane beta-barrel protein [Myxococcales bacterium]|nr:outer membrane beta-barrel protein [Myxococcales bacterium]MCB9521869.1 outer membrane beta-barrel protein [Myxococcales bacterium]
MNSSIRPRHLIAGLVALLLVGLAAPAWALDAYRDRRGLYYGLGIGGGNVTSKTDGSEGDGTLGFNIRGRLGGGVSQQLTLDGELGMNLHSEEFAGGAEVSRQLYTMYVGANFYPLKDTGLYLRGMGGMAVASVTVDIPGLGSDSKSETGLGLGAGAGFEFFVNADLAIGVGADYQWISIEDTDINMLSVGVNANWY